MMKHILYKTASLALIALAMASCDPEFTETGMLTTEDKRPIATASVSSLQIEEGKDATIKFTLDKAIIEPSILLVSLVGAENDEENNQVLEDFSLNIQDQTSSSLEQGRGFELRIPAYATEVELNISALVDSYSEGNEKHVLRIEDHTYNRVKTSKEGNPIFIPITIKDIPTLDLAINHESVLGPNGTDLCEAGVEFYLYLVSADGTYIEPVQDDCSSKFTLNANTLKSGEYTIEGYIGGYGDFPRDPVVNLTVPFSMGVAKKASNSVNLTFSTANGAWDQMVDAGTVTVNDDSTYIVKDANGKVLVDTTK
ncbi:hypothetical protein [Tenacibaculum finnmarkense]|uniref:hypothetical protein n=1 Tax=Tenacibaculum finnmarkense TaxID=2781243 RepID=UPI001E58DF9A|nr:hypothetical protein [Tenacibaculum finnmarkense]MCD8443981.1 hypothetical protein [Tenacibaculum finnmarkense genomovar ulcerans]MCG8858214.1 hypothetical protein [Tenacibaculum finnmarkense]